MDQVLQFLTRAAALLSALIAGGIVKSSSGTVIATLLADIENVVKGAQSPTPDLVNQVTALLNDLKVNNIVSGQFVEELATGLTQFESFLKDIQSGQAGVVKANESLAGVKGAFMFIPYGGAAAQALGLS